jgi:hypothetical protein
MKNEAVIEKVQALFRLGTSSNPHEAEQAMKAARRLMLKHQLDDSDVVVKTMDRLMVPFLSTKQTWETILAGAVTRYFACEVAFSKIGRCFYFYGSPTNLVIAEHAFLSVRNQLLRLVEQALTQRRSWENPKAYRTSWLLGASISIVKNLEKEVEVEKTEAPESFALARTQSVEAKTYMMETTPDIRSEPQNTSYSSSIGLSAGAIAGAQIRLTKGVNG